MNLRQPYERLIADKLRRLPVPDANASWQQMKRLLDNDEDTKAGGGKRPPGSGWWRIGAIAIVLCTSFWLYVSKTTPPNLLAKNNTTASPTAHSTAAGKGTSTSKKTVSIKNIQPLTIDNNTTLPLTNTSTASEADHKSGAVAIAVAPNTSRSANTPFAGTTRIHNNNPEKEMHAGAIRHHIAKNNKVDADDAPTKNAKARGPLANLNNVAAFRQQATRDVSAENTDNVSEPVAPARYAAGKRSNGRHQKNSLRSNGSPEDGAATTLFLPVDQRSSAAAGATYAQLGYLQLPNTVIPVNTSLALGDSIQTTRNTANLLNNDTKKAVAKAQRDKAVEDMTKKDKKGFHLDLSNLFKPFSLHMDADPRWAAGIALNNGITVNAQNRYAYNMNAKSGILTDYIPSVYLQFHLNDYVYAQTEINFVSPQYTPQLLVYQQNSDLPTGMSQQKSVYIQKLYYFNVPLTLHYSPISNLYFSAGLQFSSFQSGLVSIQEKQYATQLGANHPSSISTSVVKFKDDSIAAKLSPNEWRWQAGAEYYWNRFTIGLRYNRSFKNLLNVDLSNTLPPTPLRNESLILSVRYNLFESRKKGETAQKN